ncbi:hypothetical protein HY250_00360 [Candidatus Azambacteria bacterium]|nr:hypothetical protein [Candidatus Azambacteria bacterium]
MTISSRDISTQYLISSKMGSGPLAVIRRLLRSLRSRVAHTQTAVSLSQRKASRGRSGQGAPALPSVRQPARAFQRHPRFSPLTARFWQADYTKTTQLACLRRFPDRRERGSERRPTPSIDFLAGKINASFRGKVKPPFAFI